MPLKTFLVNGKRYVVADDLCTCLPNFLKSYKRIRNIVEDFDIKEPNYTYVYFRNDKTLPSNALYPRAKLALRVKWIKEHLPPNDTYNFADWLRNHKKGTKAEVLVKIAEKLLPLPPILELEDHEKFHDANGSPLEIEVRGERDADKCFFKIEDVSKVFDLPNLRSSTIRYHTSYQPNVDYKYFSHVIRKDDVLVKNSKENGRNSFASDNKRKPLFLTYRGVLRTLFVSKSKKTDNFISWATKTLFVSQMGTTTQRIELCKDILKHANLKEVKKTFGLTKYQFSCVYLFEIGTAGSMRDKLKLPDDLDDDQKLYKYGRTNDMARRMAEHVHDYGVEDLLLAYYAIIDQANNVKAENMLSQFFKENGTKVKCDGREEIVSLNPKELRSTIILYDKIQNECAGKLKIITDQNTRLKDIIASKNELIKSKNETIELQREIISELRSKLPSKK